MDKAQLEHALKQKYSKWGEQRPLAYSDTKKRQSASRVQSRTDLSEEEKSAVYVHQLTGCKGFEFVLFSNAKISKSIHLSDGIILYPCFKDSTDGCSISSVEYKNISKMEQSSRYVYDGWLPIDKFDELSVRNKIQNLRNVLVSFSILFGCTIDWTPKYYAVPQKMIGTLNFDEPAIEIVKKFSEIVDDIDEFDKKALFRSIGWLSKSINQQDVESKFLFAILAIESLAMYIENSVSERSALIKFQSVKKTKSERKKERERCILEKLISI